MIHKFCTIEILKKLKPKIKICHWHGVIVCRECGKIIKTHINFSDLFKKNMDLLLCPSCALELIMKTFKGTVLNDAEKVIEQEHALNS